MIYRSKDVARNFQTEFHFVIKSFPNIYSQLEMIFVWIRF